MWRQTKKLLPLVVRNARTFAQEAGKGAQETQSSGVGKWLFLAGLGGGGYYAYSQGMLDSYLGKTGTASFKPNYDAVRSDIAALLNKDPDYDDGSYGPVLVRLAWHASGTYDKVSRTGGSNGATMRFEPECAHAANAGLKIARDLLEPVKAKYPWISYADLWTLAGCVAIEEMGGPKISWRPGRSDAPSGEACPPDGRLPDGAKGAAHVRDIFYRMGFNDREIVALSGAHTLGRCHPDRSGFVGPWTNAPTTFSNLYFQELVNNTWVEKKKWSGPKQYVDKKTGELMMLPTDMSLLWDKNFAPIVRDYAKNEDIFFQDFAAAFGKLMELGVPTFEKAAA